MSYKLKYTGQQVQDLLEQVAKQSGNYNNLENKPIINQDLTADGFTPVTGTYYRHTGTGGGGTPAPVNPIAVGDTLTKLYFDTTKTPDFSLLDWSNATENENLSGSIILTLLSGQYHTDQRGIISAVKLPAGATVQGISFANDNYLLGFVDGFAFVQGEELSQLGSGWIADDAVSLSMAEAITIVNQQDIWGAYISKDGQWTSGGSAYTTGAIYYYNGTEYKALEGGSSVNIVQTTGTSTTDVMSQDAVTKSIPTKVSQLTNDAGFTTNQGTVTQVKVNGTTYTADSSGLVDLGTIGGTSAVSTYNDIY